jgi:hypothetical protein
LTGAEKDHIFYFVDTDWPIILTLFVLFLSVNSFSAQPPLHPNPAISTIQSPVDPMVLVSNYGPDDSSAAGNGHLNDPLRSLNEIKFAYGLCRVGATLCFAGVVGSITGFIITKSENHEEDSPRDNPNSETGPSILLASSLATMLSAPIACLAAAKAQNALVASDSTESRFEGFPYFIAGYCFYLAGFYTGSLQEPVISVALQSIGGIFQLAGNSQALIYTKNAKAEASLANKVRIVPGMIRNRTTGLKLSFCF